jgi:multicomponent K+:H+ antiporter subunit D
MNHWLILPVVAPAAAAAAMLLFRGHNSKRALAFATMAALVLCASGFVALTGDGLTRAYALGGWPAPYGIVLVLDRTAALMLALTSLVATAALAAAWRIDQDREHFHALVLFLVTGLNSAFLAGDLFNLFVCFEILLLASYALLAHGGHHGVHRAALAYVTLNLVGSAVFLVALALLYGAVGTLNLADMAHVMAQLPQDQQAPVRTALALLAGVFLLKAAAFPLSFWLPHAYASAAAPVAALFAIMTKVGVYALMRVGGVLPRELMADTFKAWLPSLAIATMLVGALGILATRRFSDLTANLVLVSSGALLGAIAVGSPAATAGALAYLPHTTLMTAALFIMSGLASVQPATGAGADPRPRPPLAVQGAFLVLALGAAGMPPLFGFVAKFMMLEASLSAPWAGAFWFALLGSGFVVTLALAKFTSAMFWEARADNVGARAHGALPEARAAITALAALATIGLVMAVAAEPIVLFAQAAAVQLHDAGAYQAAIIADPHTIERQERP